MIGETTKNMHYRNMGRLRILAMVLSCLADLAVGALMAALALSGAFQILGHALAELRQPK